MKNRKDEVETVVRVAIKPSDPDFPFELDVLQVQLNIPNQYPERPCSIKVLNADIPKGYAFNIEKGHATYFNPVNLKAHQTLVRQMNWLDRNLEDLLQQAPAETVRFVSNYKTPDNTQTIDDKITIPISQISVNTPSANTSTSHASTSHASTSHASTSNASTSHASTSNASTSNAYTSHVSTSNVSTYNVSAFSTSTSVTITPIPSKEIKTSTQNRQDHQIRNKPTYSKHELKLAKIKRESEYNQLMTRFCDSFKALRSNIKEEKIVGLTISINDPDFTHEQQLGGRELAIKYHIPTIYPLQPCTLEIDSKNIDKTRCSWIQQGFDEHVRHSNCSLFENLNWLNRNIEHLWSTPPTTKSNEEIEADKLAVSQKKQLAPPKTSTPLSVSAPIFTPKQLMNKQSAKLTSLFDEDTKNNRVIKVNDPALIVDEQLTEVIVETDSGDAPESTQQPHEDDVAESSTLPLPMPAIKKGTDIRLMNFKLENVTLFRCTSLHVILKCAKCKDTLDVENIRPESEEYKGRWLTCPTCSSVVGVKFIGDMVHQGSVSLGLLQLAGCVAYDLLPSMYTGTCSSCMEDIKPVRLSFFDSPTQFNCFSCHTKIIIHLDDYKFLKIGDGGERLHADEQQIMKLKKKSNKNREAMTFVIGQPLPDQGTCSHYRKSNRWFRFTCCNRLYPCDICHDSHEDHVYEMAKKHICGLCSREQSIQAGKSCACGHEFTKVPMKGAFWEGGKGVRNKTTMSRKDPHKHKGIGKTSSKRLERVGVAGKKHTQAQAEKSDE
ncbi:hypothetical protein BDB01DRAFT_531022 [Pilobolus umbonatus]|nr:hypothetical protein BDB01DRAFT_531022 [Pilobolus umbonatus]